MVCWSIASNMVTDQAGVLKLDEEMAVYISISYILY